MKLSEYPKAIKEQSFEVQRLSEIRDRLLTTKKEADIAIERMVQSLDKKVCSNDTQREIARFDFRDAAYETLLFQISIVESDLAVARFELQYLKDGFAVAKLELQANIIE